MLELLLLLPAGVTFAGAGLGGRGRGLRTGEGDETEGEGLGEGEGDREGEGEGEGEGGLRGVGGEADTTVSAWEGRPFVLCKAAVCRRRSELPCIPPAQNGQHLGEGGDGDGEGGGLAGGGEGEGDGMTNIGEGLHAVRGGERHIQ